ncbi:MAG TPA: hypothetical protein VGP24_17460 [Glaciihabitans sp.]|jgi:ABC-2 type transport system permease protein|nr:hypothetical protein [Glaciihabitans sp.]
MSAAVLSTSATIAPNAQIGFGSVLRSEWIKLTSLRSTVLSLLAVVLIIFTIAVGLAATMGQAGLPDQTSARFALTHFDVGIQFSQFVVAVLGVLAITGEYSSGTIQSTLTTVPRRLLVLTCKAIALFALVFTVGALSLFGAWAATYPLFDQHDLAIGLGEPGFALALIGGALNLALTAVFALGLGVILRSAAGGTAAVLGVLLILPLAASIIASGFDWVANLAPYMLSAAGEAMAKVADVLPAGTVAEPGSLLHPAMGTLVVLIWTAVSLLLAALALHRRDA